MTLDCLFVCLYRLFVQSHTHQVSWKILNLPERAVREPNPPGLVFSWRKPRFISWRAEKCQQKNKSVLTLPQLNQHGMVNRMVNGMVKNMKRNLTKAFPPFLWVKTDKREFRKNNDYLHVMIILYTVVSTCSHYCRHFLLSFSFLTKNHPLPRPYWGRISALGTFYLDLTVFGMHHQYLKQIFSRGGMGYSGMFCVGMCCPGLQSSTPFKKKLHSKWCPILEILTPCFGFW